MLTYTLSTVTDLNKRDNLDCYTLLNLNRRIKLTEYRKHACYSNTVIQYSNGSRIGRNIWIWRQT